VLHAVSEESVDPVGVRVDVSHVGVAVRVLVSTEIEEIDSVKGAVAVATSVCAIERPEQKPSSSHFSVNIVEKGKLLCISIVLVVSNKVTFVRT